MHLLRLTLNEIGQIFLLKKSYHKTVFWLYSKGQPSISNTFWDIRLERWRYTSVNTQNLALLDKFFRIRPRGSYIVSPGNHCFRVFVAISHESKVGANTLGMSNRANLMTFKPYLDKNGLSLRVNCSKYGPNPQKVLLDHVLQVHA